MNKKQEYLERQKQFNRINISIKDLDQAIKYLKRFNEIPSDSKDFEVRSAFLVAAIISYIRPFTNNYDNAFATGKQEYVKSEQTEIIEMTNQRVFDYHKKIKDLRNKAIAHSDYKKNPTQRIKEHSTENGFLTISYPFNILSVDLDTSIFLQLAEAGKKVFENKLCVLNRQMNNDESKIESYNPSR